jgi:hypothetical protein
VLDQGRVRLTNLLIYVERTIAPTAPLPPGVMPRPYGLAATALEPTGTVLAAVVADEAVWLGFQAIDPAHPVIIRVRVGVENPMDALSGGIWNDSGAGKLRCPPNFGLAGLRCTDGFLPFGAGDTLTVLVDAASTSAEALIRLVSPETFTSLTGTATGPLNPQSAFKGYRLP